MNNNITSAGSYTILDTGQGSNTLIYNNTKGQIIWTSSNLTTNITLRIGNTIYFAKDLLGLTDNSQAFNLNSTARIEIRSLTYNSMPQLLKNGVRCEDSKMSEL